MKALAPRVAAWPWDPAALLAVAAALGLRFALLALASDPPLVNDEVDYWRLAGALAAGEGFTTSFRPPLYPAFLALLQGAGADPIAVRGVQALLSAACVPLVYALGLRAGGRRSARIAAWLFALDPVLVGFSGLLWSETLYLLLFLGGAVCLLAEARRARPVAWGAAGLCFGLGILARPQLATFVPWLLPWAWLQARRSGAAQRSSHGLAVVLLLLGAAVVVLPWSVRNARVLGTFVLVDSNGPYNLLVSTEPGAFQVDKDDRWNPAWGALGRLHYALAAERQPGLAQRQALGLAVERITAQPVRFAEKSLWEATHLFTLDSFPLRHLRNGWYPGDVPRSVVVAATLLTAGFSAFLLAAGIGGLAAQPPSPFRGFAALALGHAVVLFGLTYSLSRYAVPLRPLLAVAAAWLLAHPREAGRRLSPADGAGRLRLGICAIAAAWLLLAWSRDLPLLADMLATGGAGHPFVRGFSP